ncbi:MAG: pseudouridylate synthase [Deltaproteobacteria bacterium]|nr:pseudouridylate synthase [Deltaproteobacteria bacterium]TLN03335.1 MAG: pseudouridylate synthase [bacterium]
MTGKRLEILYRDDHFVAVNKPAGLLVHRSDLDRHETEFALQLVRNQLGCHVYPVHRLDRPTSGVLLFALSPEAARRSGEAFDTDTVRKTYLAVVRGVTEAEARIDYPLLELPERYETKSSAAQSDAKEALTNFRRLALVELPLPLGKFPTVRYSLLEVRPGSGRRHQIRRHLKHVFHPIIGDTTYGEGRHNRLFRNEFGCSRMLLHAVELAFPDPWSGATVTINAPLDQEFSSVIRQLGWQGSLP